MEPQKIVVCSYEDFVRYTDNFSESNCIGHFQFGKLYRAKINFLRGPRYMLVKTWKDPEIYNCRPADNQLRLMKELILHRHEMLINHPGMVKLYGCTRISDVEHPFVAYDFKPFDSLFNLIPKDDFTWLQRIKAALGLASLLKFLDRNTAYKPFIVHNLDAAHVVLGEDYNPKLCDLGLLSGGIFPEKKTYSAHDIIGCYGYIDMGSYDAGYCSTKNDVFAFGVILASLISKRVYTEEDRVAGAPCVYEWALREAEAFESEGGLKNTAFSLVHKSIAVENEFHPGDGHKITKLALDCVNGVVSQRPTMKQVYRSLRKLEAVKKYADFLEETKESNPPTNGF